MRSNTSRQAPAKTKGPTKSIGKIRLNKQIADTFEKQQYALSFEQDQFRFNNGWRIDTWTVLLEEDEQYQLYDVRTTERVTSANLHGYKE
jgi:hypothetical protein